MNSEWISEIGLPYAATYERGMEEAVLPLLQQSRRDDFWQAPDGAQIFVSRFQTQAMTPKGTVVVVHGFTENLEKFSEVIFGFLHAGYSVLALDQRGHGRSSRDEALGGDTSVTHIDRFDQYVKDLEGVCERFLGDMLSPHILFAHSMGGAVALLVLERGKIRFQKAVLSSPMVAPETGGFPTWISLGLCKAAILFGKAKKGVFLIRPYHGHEHFETACSNGKERFEWYDNLRFETPAFQNSNPSYRWTLESIKVTKDILERGAVERIKIPVCLYSAKMETLVKVEPQKELISRLPKGKFICVEGAKHEIYRSPDAVLFPWWRHVLRFLED